MAYEDIRWRDNPNGIVLMCSYCKHRTDTTEDGIITCCAFPNGIPRELLLRREHETPYPGDNGIRFEPRED